MRSIGLRSQKSTLFLILLFSVAAMVSFWFVQVRHWHAVSLPPLLGKPDYYVEQFSILQFTAAGKPSYQITGKSLTHYPADDAYLVTLPAVNTLDPTRPPMHLRAERAWVVESKEGIQQHIHLYDHVTFHRLETSNAVRLQAETSYLLVLPKDEIVKTNQFVHMEIDRSTLVGTGMLYQHKARKLQLHHRVQGRYSPSVSMP